MPLASEDAACGLDVLRGDRGAPWEVWGPAHGLLTGSTPEALSRVTGRPEGTADSASRNWRPQGEATLCTRYRRSPGSPRDVRDLQAEDVLERIEATITVQ
jgi:hypothetical protein